MQAGLEPVPLGGDHCLCALGVLDVVQRGPETRSFNQVFEAFDSRGASMHVHGTRHTVDFSIKCLGGQWEELFDVLLDVLWLEIL